MGSLHSNTVLFAKSGQLIGDHYVDVSTDLQFGNHSDDSSSQFAIHTYTYYIYISIYIYNTNLVLSVQVSMVGDHLMGKPPLPGISYIGVGLIAIGFICLAFGENLKGNKSAHKQ